MKRLYGAVLLAYSALVGCYIAEPTVTRNALVGNYVYISEDPENKSTDHEWDHLTLRLDGRYKLVQGGPTKAKSEKVGLWNFFGGRWSAEVMMDDAGFPVRVRDGEVRLMLDEDVGIWYAKVK